MTRIATNFIATALAGLASLAAPAAVVDADLPAAPRTDGYGAFVEQRLFALPRSSGHALLQDATVRTAAPAAAEGFLQLGRFADSGPAGRFMRIGAGQADGTLAVAGRLDAGLRTLPGRVLAPSHSFTGFAVLGIGLTLLLLRRRRG
ncbi:hypothetical protein [Chitinimonas koreensis]|uniref:hypothetical protein n=1 Tax=Chitinimonas koreensis TaxID=356302 RepID=UPI0003F5FD27|nr:hypothetical protein [Chitinimonas koreensis]QNM95042.1 hypothetical protein H9L41_14115 [Chitinimonas koreensis]